MTRGPDSICTAADRRAWIELVRWGRTVAAAPAHKGNGHAFGRAAIKTLGAVFPDLTEEGRKPFLRLLGFAKAWAAMEDEGRRANAQPLSEAAEACAAVLGLDDIPPPPPPFTPGAAARRLPYRDDTFEEDAA